MPDIAMCNEPKCPRALECYRYMAIPYLTGQVYFDPIEEDFENCADFWPITKDNE